MSKDNGGPAFPAHPSAMGDHDGMTLRDYFAAKAMQAFIASGSVQGCADVAYKVADAMLEAREE